MLVLVATSHFDCLLILPRLPLHFLIDFLSCTTAVAMRKILCFSFTLFCSATFWTCDEVVSEQCELTVHKGQVVIQSIPVTYWRYRARRNSKLV